MLYFTLPNFYHFKDLNNRLINLYRTHLNYFTNTEIQFIAQEGSLPFHYWNGGATNNIGFSNYNEMCNLSLNFSCALIYDCSNPLIQQSDLLDSGENINLSLNDNGSNAIIISNPAVMDYIHSKYPYYSFIGSEYYYMYSDDHSNLKRIRIPFGQEEKFLDYPISKIELSIYESCYDCKDYENCRLKEWQNILNYKHESIFQTCKKTHGQFYNMEQIKKLSKKGYKYFYFDVKHINPQTDLTKMLDVYLQIFIKSEYRDLVDLYLRGIKE